MTWYFNPTGDGTTMDVYDQEGSLVAEGTSVAYDSDGDPTGSWSGGDYPDRVFDIMRENMEGTKPSSYNQDLLADAATQNIEKGIHPDAQS